MKLLELVELIPVPNEVTRELERFDSRPLMINPNNLQAASSVKELKDKVVVTLTNGKSLVIDQTLKELSRAFEYATQPEDY